MNCVFDRKMTPFNTLVSFSHIANVKCISFDYERKQKRENKNKKWILFLFNGIYNLILLYVILFNFLYNCKLKNEIDEKPILPDQIVWLHILYFPVLILSNVECSIPFVSIYYFISSSFILFDMDNATAKGFAQLI